MKNKISTITITKPMENKKAKAELKQIYSDIVQAEKVKKEISLNDDIILRANQEKDLVLKELKDLNSKFSLKKEELATINKSVVNLAIDISKLDKKKEQAESELKEFNTLPIKRDALKKEISELELKLKKSEGVAIQFNLLQSKLLKLQNGYDQKAEELALNEQEIKDRESELKKETKSLEVKKVELKRKNEVLSETFDEKQSVYDKLFSEVSHLTKIKIDLKEEITRKQKEAKKNLKEELNHQQIEFDNKLSGQLANIQTREGNLSLDEKRLKKKRNELREIKKNIEDVYGRKISIII